MPAASSLNKSLAQLKNRRTVSCCDLYLTNWLSPVPRTFFSESQYEIFLGFSLVLFSFRFYNSYEWCHSLSDYSAIPSISSTTLLYSAVTKFYFLYFGYLYEFDIYKMQGFYSKIKENRLLQIYSRDHSKEESLEASCERTTKNYP